MTDEIGFSPYTGQVLATYEISSAAQVQAVVEAAVAVAPTIAETPPTVLAHWLESVAAALVVHRDELAELADGETGLGMPRLLGEVEKTANQLRFYAAVAEEGAHLGATIDTTPLHIGRVSQPIGPVAVFGASNFPFAFGVLGHDTGSALAAGNPVVAKGHPACPDGSSRSRWTR